MPKEVDHDQRRSELLRAVWRVIGQHGLEGATIRGIAQETGWSPGAVAHYFEDKDDILRSALELAETEIADRLDRRVEKLSGLAALRELIMENLPLDDDREMETKFLMNYWSRAIRDREHTPQPPRTRPTLMDRMVRFIREGQSAGEISTEQRPEDIAELLYGLIDGFSLHTLLDPGRLTRKRQIALVDKTLDLIRTDRAAQKQPPTTPRPKQTTRSTNA